jgi:hypothetical protein
VSSGRGARERKQRPWLLYSLGLLFCHMAPQWCLQCTMFDPFTSLLVCFCYAIVFYFFLCFLSPLFSDKTCIYVHLSVYKYTLLLPSPAILLILSTAWGAIFGAENRKAASILDHFCTSFQSFYIHDLAVLH